MANNRNGLDVDKYDYLQRDSMYCNTKVSVDIKRIFSFVKVPPFLYLTQRSESCRVWI